MNLLHPRWRELILLLVSGLACKEAAEQMGISHTCAKNYLNRAQHKLRYRTRDQLMFELGQEQAILAIKRST